MFAKPLENKGLLADREGFEPSMDFRPYSLSRGAFRSDYHLVIKGIF